MKAAVVVDLTWTTIRGHTVNALLLTHFLHCLRNSGVWCSNSEFFRYFLRCLSRQETGLTGKRKTITVENSFSYLEYAFLSVLPTQGFHVTIVMASFILPLVCMQLNIPLANFKPLNQKVVECVDSKPCRALLWLLSFYYFPLTFLRMSQEDMSVPPWEAHLRT